MRSLDYVNENLWIMVKYVMANVRKWKLKIYVAWARKESEETEKDCGNWMAKQWISPCARRKMKAELTSCEGRAWRKHVKWRRKFIISGRGEERIKKRIEAYGRKWKTIDIWPVCASVRWKMTDHRSRQ